MFALLLLAQVSADPQSAGQWAKGFIYVMGSVVVVLWAIYLSKELWSPKPPIAEQIAKLATKEELAAANVKHTAEQQQLRKDLTDTEKSLREAAQSRHLETSSRLDRIESRAAETGKEIGAVAKSTDLIIAQLDRLQTSLERSNERTREEAIREAKESARAVALAEAAQR